MSPSKSPEGSLTVGQVTPVLNLQGVCETVIITVHNAKFLKASYATCTNCIINSLLTLLFSPRLGASS